MTGTKTLTIIKPSAVSNKYIGPILAKIYASGFHIAALKFFRLTRIQAQNFYAVHKAEPFYDNLVEYMTSGPVLVAILEKQNAVEYFRELIGNTDPAKAKEGTLRKSFAESVKRNAVHGSDNDENAENECDFFFAKSERFSIFED